MGQLDKQPENSGTDESQAAEARLKSIAREIENLQHNLVDQLYQDVERLQREKSQLIEDIETLKAQRQQQIVQQQQLVQKLAPALANHLIEQLTQRLDRIANSSRQDGALSSNERGGQNTTQGVTRSPKESLNPAANDYNENAYRLLASLDTTLRTTFRTLQRDLSSYQSSLSQQLAQMYNLEQQGEAILEALVSRLRAEIQVETSEIESLPLPPLVAPTPPSLPQHNGHEYPESDLHTSITPSPSQPPIPMPLDLEQHTEGEEEKAQSISPPQSQSASKLPLGFLLFGLSLLALSLEYVAVAVIFNKSSLFGLSEPVGGFLSSSVGNAVLVLWMRMLIVVPLMTVFATRLHPGLWRDIRQFAQSQDWRLFLLVAISGCLRFVSEALIYLALSSLSPGIALTIFFIYPIITTLVAWGLFGDRFSLGRCLLIFSVLAGFVLVTLPDSRVGDFSRIGVNAAIGSAITFALHLILLQTYGKKLHGISLSWINFVSILVFSGLSLAVLPLPESWRFDLNPSFWPSLAIGSLVLAGTTLASRLLDTFSIKIISPVRASILGAAIPALTALLAFVLIQSSLQVQQILGMLLVTLGVAGLRFAQWRRQTKAT